MHHSASVVCANFIGTSYSRPSSHARATSFRASWRAKFGGSKSCGKPGGVGLVLAMGVRFLWWIKMCFSLFGSETFDWCLEFSLSFWCGSKSFGQPWGWVGIGYGGSIFGVDQNVRFWPNLTLLVGAYNFIFDLVLIKMCVFGQI